MKRTVIIEKTIYALAFLLLALSVFMLGKANASEEVGFVRELTGGMEDPVDAVVADNGDIYVLDRGLAKVWVFSPEGDVKWSFGGRGADRGQLDHPQSLALTVDGGVIVADTGNDRLEVFAPDGSFSYQLGQSGYLPGTFQRVTSVTVDPQGFIYAADKVGKAISRYSPHGVFLERQPLTFHPEDLTFDVQGNRYVLVPENAEILRYPAGGGEVRTIKLPLEKKDYLKETSAISVDDKGNIYIVELQNHSIIKIGPTGQVVFSFGSQGEGKGQFNHPQGIVAVGDEEVLVVDSRNKRVQIFEIKGQSGTSLAAVSRIPPVVDYDSAIPVGKNVSDIDVVKGQGLYALSDYRGEILLKGETDKVLGVSSDKARQLNNPQALQVLPDGRVIVADTGSNRLQFLSAEGANEYEFGKKGRGRSEFLGLQGVTVDREGYIYVADTKNDRIQVFNSDGIYLKDFGERSRVMDDLGAVPGTFRAPKDLAMNSRDQLYVLDYENKRIQVFERDGTFVKEIGGSRDPVRFQDPVDIAIDREDYLFVADKGENVVKILDPEGRLVTRFGSAGQGPSYFPALSSVAVSDGKVYVADYQVPKVKVFRFDPHAGQQQERCYFVRVSKPLNMENASDQIKVAMARKLTVEEAKKEIALKLNLPEEDVAGMMNIESEKMLNSGQLQVTMSVPKQVLPEGVDLVGKK